MKRKKFDANLLNEELQKFRLLSEYDFYQEKKEGPEYNEIEEEDAPSDLEPTDGIGDEADNVAAELGVDAPSGESPEQAPTEDPNAAPAPAPAPEPPVAEPAPAPIEEPNPDEVEVDVTTLVKGSEEAKDAADTASKNSQILLQKLGDLEARVASMSVISHKIDDLEKEMIKRNPTPVEKLEMRSLDSYPFNQKLTDYWADKEGSYDVMANKKPEQYVLKQRDVDDGYVETDVKRSFNVNQNPYDEEDVNGYEEENI